MSMKKDTFLYLNMNDRLFGLNLREFTERHSSKPEFEVVQVLNNPNGRRPGKNFNVREKDCMIVFDSKLYMMTETRRHRGDESLDLNVYSFDPTDQDDRKSIRLCDESASPRMMDNNYPIVFTLEEKIYVLGVPSYSYRRRENGEEEPQLFWVFDPFHEFWKQLPHPPLYNFDRCISLHYDVSYGHKLVVRTYNQSYVFDAHQERWAECHPRSVYDEYYFEFRAVAEFDDGFLIAVPLNNKQKKSLELVAYKLDEKGIPQQHQVLHELNRMFSSRPLLSNPQVFLGKCDDNLMWLVYSGKDNVQGFTCIGVSVFRVSMSYDDAGNEVFSVDIEAADFIDLKSLEVQDAEKTTQVYSASAMCHDDLKTNCKDWFLYLNVGDRLCRLNISEFCRRRISFMPKTFELVHLSYPEGHPSKIPSRMRHIVVGSKALLQNRSISFVCIILLVRSYYCRRNDSWAIEDKLGCNLITSGAISSPIVDDFEFEPAI